jgi:hypothetical protein
MTNKLIHALRYGTAAEKKYLEKDISTYDFLAINGNTAAYSSASIAKLIIEKFMPNESKGFFIDPITYAFQAQIDLLKSPKDKTKLKKSISQLIDYYGKPVNKVKTFQTVKTTDFMDSCLAKMFCEKVIEFEHNFVNRYIKGKKLEKYFAYLTNDITKLKQLYPTILVAPYFYLNPSSSDFSEWLKINANMIKLAGEIITKDKLKEKLFGQLVLSKNILQDDKYIKEICEIYNSLKLQGVAIWIDDFDEHKATDQELHGYLKLLTSLHCEQKINLYGGYFSILLTHKSLNLLQGVSHGLEYGENRTVYPVGGGLPVSKYYFFPLHQRINFTKAFYYLREAEILDVNKINWGSTKKYYNQICDCKICKQVLKNDMINFIQFESREFYEQKQKNGLIIKRPKASKDTKQICLEHYLFCKKIEFEKVKTKPIKELLYEMIDQRDKYSANDSSECKNLEYLLRWRQAILPYI